MNVKQNTLAALLVLGIGMSGCNNSDSNPTPPTDNKNKTVDQNKTGENNDTDKKPPVENNNTEENRTAIILGYIGSQHSNHNSTITVAQLKAITPALSNIIASNLNSYRSYIEDPRANFSTPATIAQVQIMLDTVNTSKSVLGSIGNQHSNGSSDITVAQLQNITPALSNIDDRYLNIYQTYIASADTNISSPATTAELQSMIDEVNDLNLPEHAILDRSFFKKTNGAFEHRFVYLPVENTTTGRTWLNNNLGADYANVDSSNYGASQQATAYNDHLAYGSLFQWGRKADGHELFDWTGATAGTAKHGDTNVTHVTNDNPSDSLFINQSDWRVNQDDTLWASESSVNNVCPVGYRLPLNPNGADDGENEFAVELNSWSSKDVNGSMSSDLKLPSVGYRWTYRYDTNEGVYWSGSVVPSDGNNSTVSKARNIYFGNPGDVNLHDTTHRGAGMSVRCIKDQTPAERSASILKEIGNEHNNNKSTVTVAQLKAILPALRDINDDYQDIYQRYIASTDNNFSSPATTAEVQSMINEMNALNLPEHAILDRSFFTKTNGAFEHRFVYLPVESNTTGRTWLNNNLGAEYANVDSSDYNPSQQATTSTDYLAYGSLFQWGRKADGHELINWTDGTHGTGKYGATTSKANEPSDSLYIVEANAQHDWRVDRDDTLWASESSANNVCPVGYRLPLDPTGADDGENEWYQETNTWSTKNMVGALTSNLKLVRAGIHDGTNGTVSGNSNLGGYWTGSTFGVNAHSIDFNSNGVRTNNAGFNYRTDGNYVRCIKD